MADFEEALNSLLADPDAMGQIMSLAGKLGMGTESPPSPGGSGPQPESAAPPPFAPEQLGADGPPAGAVPGQPPVQPGGRRPDRRAPALPAGGAPEKAGPSHPTGRAVSGSPAGPTAYGKRVSSIYNAYIPGGGPYEKIPEEHPPGFESMFSSLLGSKGTGGLSGLLGKLGLGKLDSGDILLLLILFLLWREGDHFDLVLLLGPGLSIPPGQ